MHPFAVGMTVRVVQAADETFPSAPCVGGWTGHMGQVVKICTSGDVGQTPDSPAVHAYFPTVDASGPYMFWPEELAPVPTPGRPTP